LIEAKGVVEDTETQTQTQTLEGNNGSAINEK
jgi:hypothetical protein